MSEFKKWRLANGYTYDVRQEHAWQAATRAERNKQSRGHPAQAVRHGRDIEGPNGEVSNWCGWCEDVARLREALESLRDFLNNEMIENCKCAGCEMARNAIAALSTPADVCGFCGDTGEVDSGAPDPQGNFIDVPCPECAVDSTTRLAQHDAEVRREEQERCVKECDELAEKWFAERRHSWGMAAGEVAAKLGESAAIREQEAA